MGRHLSSKAGVMHRLYESIDLVLAAQKRRECRIRLAAEARTKIFAQFPELQEDGLKAKWKEVEELAQLFREAFCSGEDGYRNIRIIDLVLQGVENNKVNIDRDREDNMDYTGGHLLFLQEMGIQPQDYESKKAECGDFLKTATEADWHFNQAIHDENIARLNKRSVPK